ncbi:MAG: cation-transporting P-type ATPase [bacterium]
MEYKKDRYYKLSPQELLSELQTSFDGLQKQDVDTREKIYGKNILIGIRKE